MSGLITPSLDEMVHVAKEMERRKMTIPLLIGGATTSRIHTAVKIDPHYSGAVVHVLDASRSVPVAGELSNDKLLPDFMIKVKEEYKFLREDHAQRHEVKTYIKISEARSNKAEIDSDFEIEKPHSIGIQVFKDIEIALLRKYIDWTPFFSTWMLKGKYPRIFSDQVIGDEAKKLFDDAQIMLDRIEKENWLISNAVCGIFEANSVGDDVEVYENGKLLETFHFLRQQGKKGSGIPNISLADFVMPKSSGKKDFLGAFAVTAGIGIETLIKRFEKDHDDYSSIMIKSLADRLAEACAEYIHEKIRKEIWGYAPDEGLENESLIAEKYRGIRPAPGYPACPDHTEKRLLFDLLEVEKNTGISLTESFAMYPASSVSGFYFGRPESKYFGLGKIGKDQVDDYAKRKGIELGEMERWLAPNLNYDI